MAITNKQLLAYAEAQLGRPYWYGTFGQIATATLYNQKRNQYPSQYDKWEKSTFTTQYGQRVHDCVGLIKGAVWSDGAPNATPKYNADQDVSANGIIKRCTETGDIKSIPEVKGLIVWKENHVGIYIGGGYVIEARGHAYGVVKTKVSERPWTKWGRLPADFVTYEAEKETCVANLIVLKKGMSDVSGSVTSWQILLKGYNYKDNLGNEIKIDGKFGDKTEEATKKVQKVHRLPQTGIVDGSTWEALIK